MAGEVCVSSTRFLEEPRRVYVRDLSEFKCLVFGSDTLWCTEFCKEDRRAVNSWIVQRERVGLVGRIHCRE